MVKITFDDALGRCHSGEWHTSLRNSSVASIFFRVDADHWVLFDPQIK